MRVPGFTSTGSKRPQALFGTEEGVPTRIRRAEGCRVWDVEGREYLDTTMALGAVALGYAYPPVVAAAEQAVRAGAVGPLAPVLEEEVAEALCAVVPGAESVRFFKTGAEAVAAAVRLARIVTGRDRLLTCGYHGWLDWCQSGPGIPQAVRDLRQQIAFDDLASLDAALTAGPPPAAVVIEPVIDGPPSPAWLAALRERASRAGALLVFDEIKTAFRIAVGGAAERWNVLPDLTVVGKALGNGLPIAALSGPRGIMDAATRTWISSTLATESVSLAAARAVLESFAREPVIAHLERVGGGFHSGLARLAMRYPVLIRGVRGVAQMCYLEFASDERGAEVARAAAERELLFKRNAYNFVSWAHSDGVIETVLERLEGALEDVTQRC